MTLDDKINTISTIITTSYQGQTSQGTGFFFQEQGAKDPNKQGGQWVALKKLWLVTNRHVLFSKDRNGKEQIPDNFTFHLRKVNGNRIEWFPIVLTGNDLRKRAKVHTNKTIDIGTIEILDLVTDLIKDPNNKLVQWSAVTEENLPGENKIDVEVSDEAITIGYPKGFYDQVNLFPIVKSGIIASRWNAHFNGNPYFLIDVKLFPGSSGSLVITRPINQILHEGKMFTSKDKQFAFLGVYSGEPFRQNAPIEFDDVTIIRKDGFNIGIVWYSYLVIEIVNSGMNI